MKKVTLFILLFVASMASLMAQDKAKMKSPEERAQRYTERLTKLLKLDDRQVATIGQINLETAKQIEALGAKPAKQTPAMKEFRKKSHTINMARMDKIKAVLTPAQQIELEKHRKEVIKKHQDKKKAKKDAKDDDED